MRSFGVLEARGAVAVGQGKIDVYVPSSPSPVASTTSEKLGYEVSPATVVGAVVDLVVVSVPARGQIIALDALTLRERFAVAVPQGTRVHRMGETAGVIWLDLAYTKGAALIGLEPTGRELWKLPGVIGALDSAGNRIVGGGLTAYDAHSGAIAWKSAVEAELPNKTVGETFTAVATKDESVIDVIATKDAQHIARGKLGLVSPYDCWISVDDTLYASVVDGIAPPTRTRIVAWDPKTAKPQWTALDRMSMFAESGLHTTLVPTRRDLFFLDGEEDTISAIDRVTHKVRWRRGFEGPSSMVFANDGAAAVYVETTRGIEVFRPSSAAPAAERVTVRGLVTFDAKPRSGATVRASCGVETRSDARGRFTIKCDAEGAVTVATLVKAARATGCAPADGRSETIVLEGKRVYELELPTSSACGD
jgi:hypothetical protein